MSAKSARENPAPPGSANGRASIPTDIDCEECGKPMIIRTGRRGRFLGCSGYPKCKNTAEVPAKLVEELGLNGNGDGNGHAKDSKPVPEPDEIETDLAVE